MSSTPKPSTDLDEILSTMRITNRGNYVYASVKDLPEDADVLAAVWESEGLGIIVASDWAAQAGLPHEPIFTCLTLEVYSSLESVGLTAAVSTLLAEHDISCNVIAGLNHDHLLVPRDRAAEAQELLSSGWAN